MLFDDRTGGERENVVVRVAQTGIHMKPPTKSPKRKFFSVNFLADLE